MRVSIPCYGTSVEHYKFYLAEVLFKRRFHHEDIDEFITIMSQMNPLNNIVSENTE